MKQTLCLTGYSPVTGLIATIPPKNMKLRFKCQIDVSHKRKTKVDLSQIFEDVDSQVILLFFIQFILKKGFQWHLDF